MEVKRMKSSSVILCIVLLASGWAQAQLTVAFWGDNRGNGNNLTQKICEYIKKGKDNKIINLMWHNGDVTSDCTDAQWKTFWGYAFTRDVFVKGFAHVVTSNHDNNKTVYNAQVCPFNPSNGKNCYYYHVAWNIPGSARKLHLFAMDNGHFSTSAEQMDYFNPILATIDPDDWICLLNHEPAYKEMTYKPEEGFMPGFLAPFVSKGLDFVLNGHAHVYARTHVLNADRSIAEKTGQPGTAHVSPANSVGAVHIVNGRAGTNFTSPNTWSGHAYSPNLNSSTQGLLTLLTFNDNMATVKTIILEGSAVQSGVQDSWTWTRGSKTTPVTSNALVPSLASAECPVHASRSGVHITVPLSVPHVVEITGLSGKTLATFRGNLSKSYSWSSAGSPGVYLVRIRLANNTVVLKAVAVY